MQIYVINLDRSEDRLQLMRWQMQKFGLEFLRVEAIDGSTLDESELVARQGYKNYFMPFMACRILNEVACNLSHAKALELIANGSDEYGVVMEDDALLSKNSARFLQDSSWIPENTALIKLDTGCRKTLLQRDSRIDGEYELYRCRSSNYGAVGYIISRKVASELYPILQKTPLLVDTLYYSFEFGLADQLKVLQLYPAILRHLDAGSEIQHLECKKRLWSKSMLGYIYKRLYGKLCAKYFNVDGKYKWGHIPCPLLK